MLLFGDLIIPQDILNLKDSKEALALLHSKIQFHSKIPSFIHSLAVLRQPRAGYSYRSTSAGLALAAFTA